MKRHTPNISRFACHSTMSIAVFVLAGCGSMSGLGGSSEYGCKAPEGVKCDSVSGNYYNAIQNNLPSQRQSRRNMPSDDNVQPARTDNKKTLVAAQTMPRATYMPAALRAQARVMRMWYKPWEDLDGALYDQGYVYLQIDNGRWLIDHAQRQIREAYTPIRPPRNSAPPTAQSDAGPTVMRPTAPGSSDNTASNSIAKTLDSLQNRGQGNLAEGEK